MKEKKGLIGQGSKEYTLTEGVMQMDISSIALTEEQSKKFIKSIKVGVFKQLHKKKLLTDEQLNILIINNRKQ